MNNKQFTTASKEDETVPTSEDNPDQQISNLPSDDESEPTEVRVVDKRWWTQEESSDEERSKKPSYVAELEQQITDKDELIKNYAEKYKKAAKEFEQTRTRVRRDVEKDVEREKRKVLSSFLEIIDNLDRAIEAGRSTSTNSGLLKGVELVHQQFLTMLDGYGVTQIDANGELFDPNLHNAVSTVPVNDTKLHNIIISVVKLGYKVENEVLRHASVTVGKCEESDQVET